ncbi:FtsQ-type POTRA domain-containing protein [Candidatus Pelagibacter sp.]|nr:FtsQ-type POTRA domain-containing protein [Candidatus Pelagibacter sp.]
MHQLIDKKNKIIIYLFFLFILSTTSGKFIENQKSYSSSINQINIEGLSDTDSSKISNELKNLFYRNILLVKKEEIQRILDKYNIIEEYNIKKIYPSTININIKQTKFIARLSNNNELVGANGKLIEDRENNEILPYIFGQFNSKDFLSFKKTITQSKFTFTKFKTLYFFPSNRWDILTNNNILIKLPQDNLSESLNLAYNIISNNDFENKNFIDLRINNHLIIK